MLAILRIVDEKQSRFSDLSSLFSLLENNTQNFQKIHPFKVPQVQFFRIEAYKILKPLSTPLVPKDAAMDKSAFG